MSGPRVLLMQLSERTSGKGNRYLGGWLGKASVVAFQAEEPDKWGNPVWNVYVSEPEPRADARPTGRKGHDTVGTIPADRTGANHGSPDASAKPSASPVARGDGWRGPSAYRRGNGARRAPAADGGAFHDDALEDLYR